jgi:hypothetical protein
MRHRGRHRKDGPRQGNGQPSRAVNLRLDLNEYWASRHRQIKPEAKTETDAILKRPALSLDCPECGAVRGTSCFGFGVPGFLVPLHDARYTKALLAENFITPVERDILKHNHAQARNKHLGYPTGIAFERGLFRGQGSDDGRELVDAADIYAALHHLAWRDLASDIRSALETKYGPDAFNILLQVGRVMRPAPPNSHFEKLIGKTPPPPDHRTPEEIAKYRLSASRRYTAAWQALHNAGLAAKLIVDRVVIDGAQPSWVRSSPQPGTQAELDQQAFVAGLKAIADEFDLFAIRRDRRRGAGKSRDAAD